MNKKILFIIIFILLSITSFIFISFIKNAIEHKYLKTKTDHYQATYNSMHHEYKLLSKVILLDNIKKDKVLNIFKDAKIASKDKQKELRDKLYEQLKSTYNFLKEEVHLNQLQFHLPNNISFFRFHKQSRYGDNLGNARETVSYVNKNRKAIDGFEVGRFYNGYRYVYPLFYKSEYLGSVELSFSALEMSLEFTKHYNTFADLLILKKTIERKIFKDERNNYIDSEFKNFYIDKSNTEELCKQNNQPKLTFSQKTKDIFNSKIKHKETFSLYDTSAKRIITFIKIKNPVTDEFSAIFVLSSDGSLIKAIKYIFIFIIIFLNLFFFAVFYLIHREIERKSELELLNKTLKERVEKEVDANRKKEQKFLQQSRLAQMGEMISMIAHQWRQPLTAINSTVIDIQMKLLSGKYDFDDKKQRDLFLKLTDEKYNNINEYVQFLSTTIDDFRNFFKPDRGKEFVELDKPIKQALKIIEESLISKNIKVVIELEFKTKLYIYKNELTQVILNILKNAEDNFLEQNIQNPQINIKTKNINNYYCSISISNNGGEIPMDIFPHIFDPYFSTKNEKNGTGLGLYMSKTIVQEHNGGSLKVNNIDSGVEFSIILKKETDA